VDIPEDGGRAVELTGPPASAPLSRYDADEEFRSRIIALYQGDRARFISSVVSLALAEGYGRREAVAFARAAACRVRHDLLRQSARDAYAEGRITRERLEDSLRRIAYMERQPGGE
jgi:hypothetical protein